MASATVSMVSLVSNIQCSAAPFGPSMPRARTALIVTWSRRLPSMSRTIVTRVARTSIRATRAGRSLRAGTSTL
jgi:hypothetical protein